MKFNLSVVNIIPDGHKDAINQIAELYGCGSNNLSVKLQGADGIYWGCHSWWKPEDVEACILSAFSIWAGSVATSTPNSSFKNLILTKPQGLFNVYSY